MTTPDSTPVCDPWPWPVRVPARRPGEDFDADLFDAPYVINDATGMTLTYFADEQERDDALMSGEYPDDAEPAYVSDPRPTPEV